MSFLAAMRLVCVQSHEENTKNNQLKTKNIAHKIKINHAEHFHTFIYSFTEVELPISKLNTLNLQKNLTRQNEWLDAESYINVKLLNTFGENAYSYVEQQCKHLMNLQMKCLIKRHKNKYRLHNGSKSQRFSMILHETIQFPSDGFLHLVVVDIVNTGSIRVADVPFYDNEGFDTLISQKNHPTLFRGRFFRAKMKFNPINLPKTLESNNGDLQFDHFGAMTAIKCPETIISCMDWIGLSDKDFSLKLYRDSDYCPFFHSKGTINTFLYPNVDFERYTQIKPLVIKRRNQRKNNARVCIQRKKTSVRKSA